jgi:hypothetical protein
VEDTPLLLLGMPNVCLVLDYSKRERRGGSNKLEM